MPPRSWLAKAKSVHDIGGQFYTGSAGRPWNDKQDEQAERRAERAQVRPMPVAEADRPYFGSRMHDSTVLGIERAKGVFRLRLDSINAKDFASYLASTLDLPFFETVWPVDLLLHDPQYVRAAHVDLRGGLRFIDWELLDKPEFLYDWAFRQDGRIQWIAQLGRRERGHGYDWANVFLMVDCVRMTAEDRCAETFARAYGEPAAVLYRDAVAEIDDRPIDFDVYDSHRETPDYIRRRMAVHGFTRADFVLPRSGVGTYPRHVRLVDEKPSDALENDPRPNFDVLQCFLHAVVITFAPAFQSGMPNHKIHQNEHESSFPQSTIENFAFRLTASLRGRRLMVLARSFSRRFFRQARPFFRKALVTITLC